MKRWIFGAAMAAALAGCSSESKEFSFDIEAGLTPQQQQKVETAALMLFDTCPGLRRYRDDLTPREKLTIGEPMYGDREAKGWNEAVVVSLQVAKSPKLVPAQFRASGDTCRFSVSSDAPAGVSVAKAPCASICAGAERTEDQAFFPAVR